MRISARLCLLILLLAIIPALGLAQTDYYSPAKVHEFADYLYNEGDYLRAAGEYQRCLLLHDSTSEDDALIYRIGICYLKGERHPEADRYFQRLISDHPSSAFRDSASGGIAWSQFTRGQYEQSAAGLNERAAGSAGNPALRNLLAADYLCRKEWEKARNVLFSTLAQSHDPLAIRLDSLANEGAKLPYKSKTLSAAMSAVLPGSGKMYAHRTMDGLYSLLVVGLTGWQAWEGFHKDGVKSTRGWIYGTIGSGFYLGNVYGSAVAVKIHNDNLDAEYSKKVSITIEGYFP